MADNTNEPMTDDAELAKVLEGMQTPAAQPATSPSASGISFEPTMPAPVTPVPDSALPPVEPAASPVMPEPAMTSAPSMPATTAVADPALESIKKDALTQLRPLVDRLELPPEEKFDTLLLIIRSTDDRSLVQSTYDAAKSIQDETKRAEALLDVVKEIDYFSNPAGGQP